MTPWHTPHYQTIKQWWAAGLSGREIANEMEKLGVFVDAGRVLKFIGASSRAHDFPVKTRAQHKAAQRRGLKAYYATNPKRGGNRSNHPTIFDTPKVQEAGRMWRAGASAHLIAAKLGTTHRQIYNLAHRNRGLFPKRYR